MHSSVTAVEYQHYGWDSKRIFNSTPSLPYDDFFGGGGGFDRHFASIVEY
jgi:hypothetical protein